VAAGTGYWTKTLSTTAKSIVATDLNDETLQITRVGEDGDTYQTRRLTDGRQFKILKNFPTSAQFAADLASVTSDVRWTDLDYFWLAGQLSAGRCPCWPGC
jgi:hypothetical protein